MNSGVMGPKVGNDSDYRGPACDCEAGRRLVDGSGARCYNCEDPIIPPQTLSNPCPNCGYWFPEGFLDGVPQGADPYDYGAIEGKPTAGLPVSLTQTLAASWQELISGKRLFTNWDQLATSLIIGASQQGRLTETTTGPDGWVRIKLVET